MTGFERSQNDTSLRVETPEGIEFILYPAGLLIRACAWAIDGFIQAVMLLAIAIAAGIMDRVFGIWFLFLVIFFLDWFYHMVFEIFFGGQSPGKRFMGIRVVRGDGSPVNQGASFLRNLLRFADTFMFLYPIAFICMLASPAFRRIGDWVGDTIVVYTANARIPLRFSSPNYSRLPWLEDFPMVIPARKLKFREKQAILSFARRYPRLGKARSAEIAKIWAPLLSPDASCSEAGSDDNASAIILGIAHTLSGSL